MKENPSLLLSEFKQRPRISETADDKKDQKKKKATGTSVLPQYLVHDADAQLYAWPACLCLSHVSLSL